jgi:energy-coupling factor transporter transmembrane protein EcfT
MEGGTIFKSRRFWTMIVVMIFDIIVYFGDKYLGSSLMADLKFLLPYLNGLAAMIIAAYTVADPGDSISKALVRKEDTKRIAAEGKTQEPK